MSYRLLERRKCDSSDTNGNSNEQNDETAQSGDDVSMEGSLDFRQPKTSVISSILTGGCFLVKKKLSAAIRTVVKFSFGRWPVALAVLIGYILLTGGLVAIALTGRYHEFKNDISLNSFMVPDIKVSRDFSTFRVAKDQDWGSSVRSIDKRFLTGNDCPKNNIKYKNSPQRRGKRDVPHFHQSMHIAWTLDLVYIAKGSSNNSNIFTGERLEAIHAIEQKLMSHPNYEKHCYISAGFIADTTLKQYGYCTPPNSLIDFFFPSASGYYDGQGDALQNIEDTLIYLQSKKYFYPFVSEGYNVKKKHSRFLRAQLLFGEPVKGISPAKDAQKAEFKRFLRTYIEPLEKINNDIDNKVIVLYGGGDLFDYLVERALYSDLHLAAISLGLIVLLLIVLTFSLWLSFMAVLTIVASFAMAYFFYHVVFHIEYMGILNGVSLFVIIGIGVDDIFVFINTFRQAVDNKDLGNRIYHTISVAGKATLFTSFTTAAAFAANVLSPIPAIHDFGLFMAILVASCWVSVVFVMAPSLCLWYSGIEKLEAAIYDKVMSLVGLRRNGRLRLPDDIRQFLSGNPTGATYEHLPSDVQNSDRLELRSLVEEDDDDPLLLLDDPLLLLDDESPPPVPEHATDSFGFRLQSFLYHFIATPVVKARLIILLVFLALFAGSIYFVTRIQVSKEQPKIFKATSNLQQWLELPEVALHPSKVMAHDLMRMSKRMPDEPTATTRAQRPVEKQTRMLPTTPRTKRPHTSSSKSTAPFTTFQTRHPRSKMPATRKASSTSGQKTAFNPTTVAYTTKQERETTPARPTSTTDDHQIKMTTESPGPVETNENGMSSGFPYPTEFPTYTTTENPCYKCGDHSCSLRNGSATCICNVPYTGDTCSILCPVRTMTGNCCKIPFTYQNKQQYGCIIDENKEMSSWCSLTDNFDHDRIRGFCNTTVENQCEVRTVTPNKTCCVFPFIYNKVQYYYCINLKKFTEDKYCGIQRTVTSSDEFYKCDIPKPQSRIGTLCPKKSSCVPAKKPADTTRALVYLVFGLKGIDTKSIDRRHVLKQKKGSILYDKEFSFDMTCNTKEVMKAVCWICKQIAANKELVMPGGAECFPENVRSRLLEMFPVDCVDLPKPSRSKNTAIIVMKNVTKLWFAMAFQSTTGKLSTFGSQQKDYTKWDKLLKELLSNEIVPGSLKNTFQTSETWVKMFSGIIVVDSAVYGIVISLVLCLAAVVIFTGHVLLFVVLFMTILGVLLTVIAIFYVTGWQLGGVEAVSLSILVGTSVDYCFHLVEGYILAGKAVRPSLSAQESRQWRAKAAMSHIGMSIISSAITTILAAIPLCLTQIQLFAKFGLIMTINTSISLVYTMTFTMAMLSTIGPARFRPSIVACLLGVAAVALCGGLVIFVLYLLSHFGHYCIPSPQGTPLFNC